MTPPVPPGWTLLRTRGVEGGELVLAERMREADLGSKRVLVEQFGTWYFDGRGELQPRYFDERTPAQLDFQSREPALI